MRLIDADALKKDIARLHSLNDEAEIRRAYALNPHSTMTDFEDTMVSVFDAIDEAPSIDIVRCKECRYKDMEICPMHRLVVAGVRKYDDYCSYGEREGE